jgi:hypothetical protein
MAALKSAIFSSYFGSNPVTAETVVESFSRTISSQSLSVAYSLNNFSHLSRFFLISFVMKRNIKANSIAGDVFFKKNQRHFLLEHHRKCMNIVYNLINVSSM